MQTSFGFRANFVVELGHSLYSNKLDNLANSSIIPKEKTILRDGKWIDWHIMQYPPNKMFILLFKQNK